MKQEIKDHVKRCFAKDLLYSESRIYNAITETEFNSLTMNEDDFDEDEIRNLIRELIVNCLREIN